MKFLFPALALTLVLVACGGSDNKSGPLTSAAPPAPPTNVLDEAERNQANALALQGASQELQVAQVDGSKLESDLRKLEAQLSTFDPIAQAAARQRIAKLRQDSQDHIAKIQQKQKNVAELKKQLEAQELEGQKIRQAMEQAKASVASREAELQRIKAEQAKQQAAVIPAPAPTPAPVAQVVPPPAAHKGPQQQAQVQQTAPAAKPQAKAPVQKQASAPKTEQLSAQELNEREATRLLNLAQSEKGNRDAVTTQQSAPQRGQMGRKDDQLPPEPQESFLKKLDHVNPLVICKAQYIKESRFFLFAGDVEGEMVLTCQQGFHGEQRTALARIRGFELGVGFKNMITEGEIHLFDVGFDTKAVFGFSAMVKAAVGDERGGGEAGIGVNLRPVAAGVIVSHGRITGGGGAAITLELAVWTPACGEGMTKLRKKGVDVDAIQAQMRAVGQDPCGK